MPELPDVETWKRYVDATALHQKIAAVDVDAPRMLRGLTAEALRTALEGSAFAATGRHGKFLFVQVSAGDWLMLHFGMTGRLRYHKQDGDRRGEARLRVRFAGGYRLDGLWPRRLGRIGLVKSPGAFVREEGLGIDALDPALDVGTFSAMLKDRRGSVKSALMDQRFIAGIGNVYSDEMLFQAGLHPRLAARGLDADRSRELHRALRHVLRLAIERQAEPDRLPRSWLLGHRHEGARCPRCGETVKQVKITGRTARLCPACQKP